jgi:Uncharacterised nucleotidyltransferase
MNFLANGVNDGRNATLITAPKSPGRQLQLREAVLLSFCDPLPEQCARLRQMSANEWQKLLPWLDTSGLALYFLDRMAGLQMCYLLPPAVLARLQQNLIDNTERMRGMIDESIAIHREFQSAHLWYATLKGFSLWPHSVPRPQLRSQLDLDFLVAEKSAAEARQVLERRGYHLRAVSGRSWEFKTDEIPGTSLKDLYKNVPYRCVELHVETNLPGHPSLLGRTVKLDFHGICASALSPADLLLGQGLHLFKHVCSDFSRTAHLLEFRRHVLARREDDAFWREVQSIAEENPRAPLALGVVTQLITQVMGDFAPESLTDWTVKRLPDSARLWIELYGSRSVYASFPGSKLYLLLQEELASVGIAAKRPRRRVLLPLRLPPPITRASENDTLPMRFRRHRVQLRFICSRLRFHIVEGIRYAWESLRWRQRVNCRQRSLSPLDSS